jgi:hypothetical protein
MQRDEWTIIDYFQHFIFGFIYHDIERCVEARANYVVALALLSYTEFIGGLISGRLGLKDKGVPTSNFNEALQYFPKEYASLNASLKIEYKDDNGKTQTEQGIYALFRCGMVHEFFIKGFATIYNDPDGHAQDHIGIVKAERPIEWPEEHSIPPYLNKVLEFHTNEYFRDFKSAVDRIFKLLIVDKDQRLLRGFNDSLDRVYSRRIL